MSDDSKPDDAQPRSPHHVLDELKSVLSNLGQHSEVISPTVETPPPAPAQETSEPIFSSSTPVAPPVDPTPPPPPPAVNSAPASDADFWSGNVLGWPEAAPLQAETTPMQAPPLSSQPPVASPVPPSMRPPPPMPAAPPPTVPTMMDRPPWPMDEVLPEPPPAPLSPPTLEVPSRPVSLESNALPAMNTTDPFPIPRSVDDPQTFGTERPDNPLTSAEAKPQNLIQLACMFPEGQDKIGQHFAKQLKELAAQSVPAFTVEPVLVSSWSSQSVDMNAWTKSARLSGADIMFVLTPRQDMALFQSAPAMGIQPEIATRIVAMEHVSLRTLYTDILIELKRKR